MNFDVSINQLGYQYNPEIFENLNFGFCPRHQKIKGHKTRYNPGWRLNYQPYNFYTAL